MRQFQIVAHYERVGHITLEIAAETFEQAVACLVPIIAGVIMKEDQPLWGTVTGSGEINHRVPVGDDWFWAPIGDVIVRRNKKAADVWTQTVKRR